MKHNVGFDSGPLASLCENMTSSTQLEVQNVFHCRQRRTEPRPPLTSTEHLVKLDVWFLRHASDRQTDIQTR